MDSILKIYNERKNCVVGTLLLFLIMSVMFTFSVMKTDSEKISELENKVNESWRDGLQRGFDFGLESGEEIGYEAGYKNATLKHVEDFYEGFQEGRGKSLEVNSLDDYVILFSLYEKRIEFDLNLTDYAPNDVIYAYAYYCPNKAVFNGKPLELRDNCRYPRLIRYDPNYTTEDY